MTFPWLFGGVAAGHSLLLGASLLNRRKQAGSNAPLFV
jgi:hypothetical protein